MASQRRKAQPSADEIRPYLDLAQSGKDAFKKAHRIQIQGTAVHPDGTKTRVLTINLEERTEFVRFFRRHGSPVSVDPIKEAMKVDPDKVEIWMQWASDLDLDDDDVLDAIGLDAMEEARDIVTGFFMASAVLKQGKAALDLAENSSSRQTS